MDRPQDTVLGKYRLLAELGRGGMANVYLAVSRSMGGFQKLLVVKRLRDELADDAEFVGMFLDEARLAARLNHPNVVQTLEVGEEAGRYFFVMEYLEGQPLSRLRGRAGGLPLPLEVAILADTMAGLQHAHDLLGFDGTHLGVVHRDVTPQNVFVTYEGAVKVVDFGIAKASTATAETRAGVMKGKVAYMPPEQARGERVDRRADIFAAGVMLWEALAGRRMWRGVSEITVVHRVVAGDLPALSPEERERAPDLAALADRMLARDVNERPASAEEVRRVLASWLRDHAAEVTTREAGQLAARLFESERERIKGILEERLRDAGTMQTGMYRAAPLPQLGAESLATPSGASDVTRISGRPRPSDAGTPAGTSTSSSRPPGHRRPWMLPASVLAAGGIAAAAILATRSTPSTAGPRHTAIPDTLAAPASATSPAGATTPSAAQEAAPTPVATTAEPPDAKTSPRAGAGRARPTPSTAPPPTTRPSAQEAPATPAAPAAAATEPPAPTSKPRKKRSLDGENPYGQ